MENMTALNVMVGMGMKDGAVAPSQILVERAKETVTMILNVWEI